MAHLSELNDRPSRTSGRGIAIFYEGSTGLSIGRHGFHQLPPILLGQLFSLLLGQWSYWAPSRSN
jgi:hypothetical protein